MNSTDQEIIEKMQSNPNVGMKLLIISGKALLAYPASGGVA